MIQDILLCFFWLVACLQIAYHLFIFGKLAFYKPSHNVAFEASTPPVSIIICAHNEEENLKEHLPIILTLKYPKYEVIVVDDHSTDNTWSVLEDIAAVYSQLKLIKSVREEPSRPGKKDALNKGIEESSYECLLFTDADCRPSSENWIHEMVNRFDERNELVLGYGPFNKEGSFLNKYIRYDGFMVAIQYFSFALMGSPYMGVGRNIAYKKKLYLDNIAGVSGKEMSSGDDDLFVSKAAKSSNIDVSIDSSTFIYSNAKKNIFSWYRQKTRHHSTSKCYKSKHKALLTIYPCSHLLFYLFIFYFLILNINSIHITLLFSLRLISQLYIYKKVMYKLGEKDLLILVPALDFLYFIFYFIFMPQLLINKDKGWR